MGVWSQYKLRPYQNSGLNEFGPNMNLPNVDLNFNVNFDLTWIQTNSDLKQI